MYFTSDTRICKVTVSTGTINSVAGGGSGGDGSYATAASLSSMEGVAVDSSGNCFLNT